MSDGADAVRANERDKHLRYGFWALFAFSALGFVLEAAHGLKIRWYLDATNEARRLMLTLSHAHGTLLALMNIAFALALPHARGLDGRRLQLASKGLLLASLLLPGGFLLAGFNVYAGDPGVGVLLVPPGAFLLVVSLFAVARGFSRP